MNAQNGAQGLERALGLALANRSIRMMAAAFQGGPTAGIEAEYAAEVRAIHRRYQLSARADRTRVRAMRHQTTPCDCPLNPHHRWNCALTPIWAQTIRDLDTNPWGRWSSHDVPVCRSFGCGSSMGHSGDHDTGSLAEQLARQNAKNAQQPTREVRP